MEGYLCGLHHCPLALGWLVPTETALVLTEGSDMNIKDLTLRPNSNITSRSVFPWADSWLFPCLCLQSTSYMSLVYPLHPNDDSSFGSLDNELNEDVDAPRNEVLKKIGQGSTDIQKIATNKQVKKESSSDNEGNHVKLFSKSKPVAISEASYSHVSSHDHSQNVPFDSSTSKYFPEHTTGAHKSSRRHQRCSEPSSHDQHCKLSHLVGIYSKKQQTTSYEADHLDGEDDYLKPQKTLQMEGQKLINQSLVMGIKVGKSSAINQNAEKFSPSNLNTCPSTSSTSLSSPGTSPSGSSVSSQDSDLLQMSEHFVLTPADTSSPVDCAFQEDPSSDLCSSGLISGMPAPASGQTSSQLAYSSKDSVKCPSHSVTLHPMKWLRNGMAALKNWSLRKKPKAYGPEEEKRGSLKRCTEPPAHASGVSEARSLHEKQEDVPLRAAEELESVQAAECCSSYPSQDSEIHFCSALNLVEDSLKLCMQSNEGESSEYYSFTLCLAQNPQPALHLNNVSSSDSGPTVICDVGKKHSTKDI
ncbi:Rho GTPase-activating protein 20 [Pteropus alecto]|uniref:Rho GTPase-activating protein 20 n=1 Tax=Pteropus alecto TaxID=9402 RepID=L5KBI1_PTEAL|nr:Rho GTPase-activating protein 20 [Pteropus alecto]